MSEQVAGITSERVAGIKSESLAAIIGIRNMATEELLTTRQVAQLLSTSTRTIERMRQTGDGPPFVRVSGGWRRGRVAYRQSAVDAWLKSRELRSTSDTRQPAELEAVIAGSRRNIGAALSTGRAA